MTRDELWLETLHHLSEGNFTALEQMLGGPEGFDQHMNAWLTARKFDKEPEMLSEALSCACMLGCAETVRIMLDAGVDPYAGMRTGLSGFHYAVSSGRLNIVKLLIDRGVPMEVENVYGGTVFGQALWSAIHENAPDHAAITEALIEAGAVVESGCLEWWREQEVTDEEIQRRVEEALQRHLRFYERVDTAKSNVDDAAKNGSKRDLADALRTLGDILRRHAFSRGAANEAYERAAAIYRELGMPLEESWVKRHIGINHEYAERLEEAEKYFVEALDLYRHHATENDLNYANTVRYPAVVKNRLGKREESKELWEETFRRYKSLDLSVAVAEAAGWLAIFALEATETDKA